MIRLASLLFGIVGTFLAGVAIIVVLTVPAWSDRGMTSIPIAAGLALLLAAPMSVVIAMWIIPGGRRPA